MKTNHPSKSKWTLAATALALLAMTSPPAQAVDNTGTGGDIIYTDATGLNPRPSPPYSNGYVVHKFTGSGTLNIPSTVSADVLVVAGGGAGGANREAGGGGAGGYLYSTEVSVAAGDTSVTVGAGGIGTSTNARGAPGNNSVFGAITATGGGGGGTNIAQPGGTGGSGGAGYAYSGAGGTRTDPPIQGNNGANGGYQWAGGGGGAGAAATDYNGGAGLSSSISGSTEWYAGGGGGGRWYTIKALGGIGGGGNGEYYTVVTLATSGTANTGSGGGASLWSDMPGNGGSGIVIVRYVFAESPLIATLNPADNATGVADTANLVVTFDQTVSKGTGSIEIRKTGDHSVIETIDVTSGRVTISGAEAMIDPFADLPGGTECYVLIAAGAFTASEPFAGITDTTTWSFTTLTATGGYASWQAANGATGALDGDHDHDGVPNGIEWFLTGSNNSTGATALPGVTHTGGTLSVTWTKAAGYTGAYPADYAVETSAGLTGTWAAEPLGGNVTITGNEVKYTFPSPLGAKQFVRLKVTGP
ncbi:MAG: Ig-like domain-containing protein [Verrucomicrobia bacterium]|nr:Ig-like domain-containing protein [Verrucomicrobiota bacterium]